MANIIGSPERYIRGRGVLKELCRHVERIGKAFFILVNASGKKRVEAPTAKSAKEQNTPLIYKVFGGECCRTEISRLIKAYEDSDSDVIVDIGGGKIYDTAKVVAHYTNSPVVIVPMIAATDAPCSALSVIYTDDGVFKEYLFLPKSPSIVLIDVDIISKAPARLLVSGMGDALATYFEACACKQSDSPNFLGGKCTVTSMAIARLYYDTLLADGLKVLLSVKAGSCSKALEDTVEASTYLSGIGFESRDIAAVHAIHNGFTAIEGTHHYCHGEKVAIGTLSRPVLENASRAELSEVYGFCLDVGLPITLSDLGIQEVDREQLIKVAELACAPNDTMGDIPFAVTPQMVCDAIIGADVFGRYYEELRTKA